MRLEECENTSVLAGFFGQESSGKWLSHSRRYSSPEKKKSPIRHEERRVDCLAFFEVAIIIAKGVTNG